MSALATLLRGWFTPPGPTFELRTASARWASTAAGRGPRRLRVLQVVEETPSTRTFVLGAADGGRAALAYRAGQHLTLLADVDGVTERRCYSFSSSPLAGAAPAITVRRKADGRVSRQLHERVHAGDTLLALEPSGDFTVATAPDASRHLVLVAGGVGITPLVSIAETVLRAEPASRVTLLTGNRSEEEIVFRTRLASLAEEFRPRLDVRHALDAPPPGWNGLAGPLDGAQVRRALGELDADAYYVCGPEPMMASVCAELSAGGVAPDRIHTERFAYADPRSLELPAHPAEITFAASGRRVTARPGQTILQAAHEAGIDLPSSCTMGGCGACKVQKREGTVVMSEPNCLSDAEREAGYLLTCCSYADTGVVIENH